jgi:flagellar FliL protein
MTFFRLSFLIICNTSKKAQFFSWHTYCYTRNIHVEGVNAMAEPRLDDELDLGIEKVPGSRKKLVIIIAVVVLLLALGGVAVWLLLPSGGGEEGGQTEPAPESATEPAESEQLPPIYHSLDPVFVVNLPPGGDVKMLQVGVDVLVRSSELEEFLKHNDPMIRNQLLNLFSSQDSVQLRTRAGKEQLQAKVLTELRKIVKQQGGTGEVEAVYFTSFVMQ